MDCLGHISCVDLVVVRVLILPIACLQGLQETHQKHSGNLKWEGENRDTRGMCRKGRQPRTDNQRCHLSLEGRMTRVESTSCSQVDLGSHPGSTTCWLCDLGLNLMPLILNLRMKITPPP